MSKHRAESMIDEGHTPRVAVLPVSLFVSSARLIVERHLGLVWVSGEVSNFLRAASGHCYFVLKDDQAQVRCVIYRQKAQLLGLALKDGEQVEVRARTGFGDITIRRETQPSEELVSEGRNHE